MCCFFICGGRERPHWGNESCRGSNKPRAPGAGVCLPCSRNSEEAGVPGAEQVPQRVTEMRTVGSRGGSRAFGFCSRVR